MRNYLDVNYDQNQYWAPCIRRALDAGERGVPDGERDVRGAGRADAVDGCEADVNGVALNAGAAAQY
jgi:hypothetical protein